MTLEEYLALPEEKPYLEYWDGVVIQKGVVGREHWELAGFLMIELGLYARQAGGKCGPEAHTWYEGHGYLLPDVAYWAPMKPIAHGENALPPTLAIEVRSPGQSLESQRTKCRRMRENGVDVCWLIDPASRTAFRFEGEADGESLAADAALESVHLPGFSLSLAKLFAALGD